MTSRAGIVPSAGPLVADGARGPPDAGGASLVERPGGGFAAGAERARNVMAHAVVEFYNPAQLRGLQRLNVLHQQEADTGDPAER
ncbi:hypothetical protein GCM10020220_001210 [Nonomuraea rubra]